MTETYDREYIYDLETQLSATIYIFENLFNSDEFNQTDIKDKSRVNDLIKSIDMSFKKLREIDLNLRKYTEALYD